MYVYIYIYILGAGHRVSRPRGTGSVGDSVGEGRRRLARALSHSLPLSLTHSPLSQAPPRSAVSLTRCRDVTKAEILKSALSSVFV